MVEGVGVGPLSAGRARSSEESIADESCGGGGCGGQWEVDWWESLGNFIVWSLWNIWVCPETRFTRSMCWEISVPDEGEILEDLVGNPGRTFALLHSVCRHWSRLFLEATRRIQSKTLANQGWCVEIMRLSPCNGTDVALKDTEKRLE